MKYKDFLFFKNKFYLYVYILFFYYDNLNCLVDNDLRKLTKILCCSDLDIKTKIPFWKELKDVESLKLLYEKKFKKLSQYGIVFVNQMLKDNSALKFIQVDDEERFEYLEFPFSISIKSQPNNVVFKPTFILKIDKGKVFGELGCVFIDQKNLYSFPSLYPRCTYLSFIKKVKKDLEKLNLKKVFGRVAVITTISNDCYFHWITEVLGKLLILIDNNIEYDWLYVPCYRQFMKESLECLGVDLKKIIQPFDAFKFIEADELIVPSNPSDIFLSDDIQLNVRFIKSKYINDLRHKYLPLLNNCKKDFSKKVFISRKKDARLRQILNEDEVFKLFLEKGFERYDLGQMSFLDQLFLFNNAEIIVGAHGAGLTNILFCKPKTKIIEIFQERSDCTYFYIAQQLCLKYDCIKTSDFISLGGHNNTIINLGIIEQFFKKNSI